MFFFGGKIQISNIDDSFSSSSVVPAPLPNPVFQGSEFSGLSGNLSPAPKFYEIQLDFNFSVCILS